MNSVKDSIVQMIRVQNVGDGDKERAYHTIHATCVFIGYNPCQCLMLYDLYFFLRREHSLRVSWTLAKHF